MNDERDISTGWLERPPGEWIRIDLDRGSLFRERMYFAGHVDLADCDFGQALEWLPSEDVPLDVYEAGYDARVEWLRASVDEVRHVWAWGVESEPYQDFEWELRISTSPVDHGVQVTECKR